MFSRIRQQRIGKDMQNLAERGILMLNEDITTLSAQDVVKLSDIGVKIERLALGNATEIKDTKVDAKVSVAVEEIDPEIAKEIGKLIAIKASKEADDD